MKFFYIILLLPVAIINLGGCAYNEAMNQERAYQSRQLDRLDEANRRGRALDAEQNRLEAGRADLLKSKE